MAFPVPDEFESAFAHLTTVDPSFAKYLLRVPLNIEMTDKPITAAVNNVKIVWGREFFASCNTDQRVFVTLHEIFHHMLGHPKLMRQWRESGWVGTRRFDMKTAQHALDYLVNDTLVVAGHKGRMPSDALHDVKIGTWMESEETIYARLYDQNKPEGDSGGGGSDGGSEGNSGMPGTGDGGDVEDEVDATPGEPVPDESQISLAAAEAVQGSQMAQKQQGSGSADFLRLVERVCPSRINWRDVVRTHIRAACGRDRVTWARFRKRSLAMGTVLPGKTGNRAGVVVLQIDTSGSIGPAEMEQWVGALIDIFKQTQPKVLHVLEVDAEVKRDYVIKDATELRGMLSRGDVQKMKGGGGTDMRMAFHWCESKGITPDTLITLTDGYTPFPSAITPAKDAVWAITSPGITAPAGVSVWLKGAK